MQNLPYRIVTIVCESFNRYDTAGYAEKFLDKGFQVFSNFSLEPTGNSGTSFVCMDSEESWNVEATGINPWTPAFRQRVPALDDKPKWISNFVTTKFFTPAWPRKWDITSLDPDRRQEDSCTMDSPMEPQAPIYTRFLQFLESDFYESDYRRVIYWSLIGHVKRRAEKENSGIPANLKQTFSLWADLILDEILPRVNFDNTVLMIHPDHGTRRKGRPMHQSVHDGWLWLRHPEFEIGKVHDRRISWRDYRRTVLDISRQDEPCKGNNSISILTSQQLPARDRHE